MPTRPKGPCYALTAVRGTCMGAATRAPSKWFWCKPSIKNTEAETVLPAFTRRRPPSGAVSSGRQNNVMVSLIFIALPPSLVVRYSGGFRVSSV
jgi:hypothetical protein